MSLSKKDQELIKAMLARAKEPDVDAFVTELIKVFMSDKKLKAKLVMIALESGLF